MLPHSTKTLFPLTSIQRDVWVDQTSFPDAPFYNIGGYLRIDGEIDPAFFDRAMRQVVHENDAIRIVLHEGNPLPMQEFRSSDSFHFPFMDFSGEDNPMEKAEAWMQREFVKPFKLHGEFLFRYALLKVSEKCYCYFNNQHHLILDGLTISLIGNRLASAYNAILEGKEEASSNPSYREFILKDQEFFTSGKFQKCQQFWAEKYSSLPEPMIPPRIGNQSSGSAFKGGFSTLWIKREKYTQLEAFCGERKASIYHLVLAVLYTYFLRTTKVKDFVFGTPVLNRSTAMAKKTMGNFTSVIPVRLDFGLELDTNGLLELIGKELRGIYRFQRFPLSEIYKLCGIQKEGGRQLFDVRVSYEKLAYKANFNGSSSEAVTFSNRCERNSLAIAIKEYHEGQDIRFDFSYNLGAFNDTDIEYFKAHFEHLMEEMVSRPLIPVSELPIMPEKERNNILLEWSETKGSYPATGACAHNLLEEHAERTPNATAAVYGDQRITYRQLNEGANQLARYLSQKGVGPDVLVGIYVTPCIDMLMGILGILKAGGAYIPLDPSYPEDRITFILQDSDANIILTRKKLSPSLPTGEWEIICLDEDQDKWAGQNKANIPCVSGPEDLAYVIYTSGSTGEPKGAMIIQKGLCNMAKAQVRIFGLTPESRVLQFASLSFDSSVSEIFMALCSGASLVLASRDELMPGPALIETINNNGVTHLTIPPSSLAVLPDDPLPSLRVFITGGEACPAMLSAKWGKKRRHIAAYGPTETTVCTSAGVYFGETGILPIGRPIDNVRYYILDEQLQPVPVGIPGELHIAGHCLARGYWKRPDLTSEKFIPNPFSRETDSRLYKTGDSVRWRPDGNIEFLGRLDNQVKIRGYRVELGEIEAMLRGHPEVKDAAVIMRGANLSGKQLEAYVIEADGKKGTLESSDLKAFLKEKLPDFMVPSFVTIMEQFPLTPNGKIDRKAFPDPVDVSQSQTARKEPSTATEKQLAEIWNTTVGGHEIGLNDDFFDSGMDSLMAIQLMITIHKEFNVKIEPTDMFNLSSIKLLAEYLDSADRKVQGETPSEDVETSTIPLKEKGPDEGAGHEKKIAEKNLPPTIVKIQSSGPKPPFFCVTAGYGDVLAFQGLAGQMGSDQPFYALQPPQKNGVPQELKVRELAAVYARNIRSIQPNGPYRLGGYSAGGLLAFEAAQQLKAAGEEVPLLIMLGAPFTYGPLSHGIYRLLRNLAEKVLPEADKTQSTLLRILRALFSDEGLKAHLDSLLGYTPQPYSGKITLFEGRWASKRFLYSKRKWKDLAEGGLEVHLTRGNHDSFIRPPHDKELARLLKACLEDLAT